MIKKEAKQRSLGVRRETKGAVSGQQVAKRRESPNMSVAAGYRTISWELRIVNWTYNLKVTGGHGESESAVLTKFGEWVREVWEERNWRHGAWRILPMVLLGRRTETWVVTGWGNGVKVFLFLKKKNKKNIACLYANRNEPKPPRGANRSGALFLTRHENAEA